MEKLGEWYNKAMDWVGVNQGKFIIGMSVFMFLALIFAMMAG